MDPYSQKLGSLSAVFRSGDLSVIGKFVLVIIVKLSLVMTFIYVTDYNKGSLPFLLFVFTFLSTYFSVGAATSTIRSEPKKIYRFLTETARTSESLGGNTGRKLFVQFVLLSLADFSRMVCQMLGIYFLGIVGTFIFYDFKFFVLNLQRVLRQRHKSRSKAAGVISLFLGIALIITLSTRTSLGNSASAGSSEEQATVSSSESVVFHPWRNTLGVICFIASSILQIVVDGLEKRIYREVPAYGKHFRTLSLMLATALSLLHLLFAAMIWLISLPRLLPGLIFTVGAGNLYALLDYGLHTKLINDTQELFDEAFLSILHALIGLLVCLILGIGGFLGVNISKSVILSFVFILFARVLLRQNLDSLIAAYSAHMKQPVVNMGGYGFPSVQTVAAHIKDKQESKELFYFILLNVVVMFLELGYGIWNNSLSLLTDAAHMFFDTASLCIGLYATTLTSLPADSVFTYGFSRFGLISGFVNGIFLVFVSIWIFIESVERIIKPQLVKEDNLFGVSILGLLVNVVGLFLFSNYSTLDDGTSEDSGNSLTNGQSSSSAANLHSVFLHVAADAIGSVSVILSAVLIKFFGLYIFDPICSLVVVITILYSLKELLQHTFSRLVLELDSKFLDSLERALREAKLLDVVTSIPRVEFWDLSYNEHVGMVVVFVSADAQESEVLAQLQRIFGGLSEHLTIQIQKDNENYDEMYMLREME